MDYAYHVLTQFALYGVLGTSLNLLWGYMGLLSLAHAAFYCIGAYIAALLVLNFAFPIAINLLIATIFGAIFGGVIAFLSLRMRNDYFVIATFAFQAMLLSLINGWTELTRGPMGLVVPPAELFGYKLDTEGKFLPLSIILLIIVLIIAHRITHAPFVRVLKALREDERLAMSRGKYVLTCKIQTAAVSGAMATMSGVLLAYQTNYVAPSSFSIMESVFIISIVVVGGAGRLKGPLLGAALLIAMPEALRFIGISDNYDANGREIIYGVALILFMRWRPHGFFGDPGFKISMEKR